MNIKPIAIIENNYATKFAIPRQSGIAESVISKIILLDEYADPAAIKGLEGFSHIWLIWEFDKNAHISNSLTVRPPRLGGNERMGVFATRSPYRPNPIGLSSVKIEKIEVMNNKTAIYVSGADIMSGTKIYDIKPYISFSDCHNDATCGFADKNKEYKLKVTIPDELKTKELNFIIEELIPILEGDPRPAYHNNPERIYGFKYANYEIKFRVEDGELTVLEISNE